MYCSTISTLSTGSLCEFKNNADAVTATPVGLRTAFKASDIYKKQIVKNKYKKKLINKIKYAYNAN